MFHPQPTISLIFPLRHTLLVAASSLLAAFCSKAATYYWDANGISSGFGLAGGTWTTPTSNLWNTNSSGTGTLQVNLTTSISDDLYFGGNDTFSYLQSGTVNISGTVNARSITFGAYSEVINLAGGAINLGTTSTISCNSLHTKTISSTLSGAATSLTVTGGGILVLSGNNSYAGQTIISVGTLAITGSQSGTGAINLNGGILNLGNSTSGGTLAATALNMNGGEFRYSRTDSAIQSFATTQINSTQASFVVNTGNTLDLGTINRTVGTTPSLSYTGLGTLAANTDSNVGGIIPGLHFGNNWAVANGAGSKITALATYTQTSVAGTTASNYTGGNIDVNNSAGTLSAGVNANSIRFGAAAANILALTGLNTLASGGILVSNMVGNNLSTITGGSLAGAAGKDLHIIQSNTLNGLTIASSIANNGSPTALTKSGTGLLTLSGNNSFTGGLIINDGEVALANPGALNSTAGSENSVNFTKRDGGSFSLKGNSITLGSLNGVFIDSLSSTHTVQNASASNATLTIGNSLGLNSTFDGPIQNGTGGGSLALVKRGTGTLILTNPYNNYSGGTTIHAGTLSASRSAALGVDTSTVTFAGDSTLRTQHSANPSFKQNFFINSGVTAKFDTINQYYSMWFDGKISGSGTLWIAASNNGNGEIRLNSTSNDHTGPIRIGEGPNNGNLVVMSLLDANNPIEFGGTTGSGTLNIYGTSARNFTQRTFTLSGTTGGATIKNWMVQLARITTIQKNLAITGVGNKTLTLGGTHIGNNAFNGIIPDGTGSIISFTKVDTGKWVLSQTANSYSGSTRIMEGMLEITKLSDGGVASSIGQSGSGPKNLIFGPADGTLRYTGTGDSTDRNFIMLGNTTLESSGSGAIVFDQTGIISPDVTGLVGTFFLGNATVSGLASTADLMVGMAVTSDAFSGTKTITAINSNSSITLNSGSGILFGTFGLTVGQITNRTLRLAGTQTAANTISGILQDSSNHSITSSPGVLNIVKQDAGTWRLDGLNTYTGATTVSGGTLEVSTLANGGEPSSIGAATSDAGKLLLGNGTTLRYTGDGHSTDRNFTMLGSVTIDASGSGALVFEQTGAMSPDITGLTGTFTSNNATVNGLASTVNLVVGMTITSAAFTGTKTITAINSSSSITLNSGTGISAGSFGISAAMAGARTLTLRGKNAAANTITGILQDSSVDSSGVLSLVKNDSGTWILAGDNTYSGNTTINGGILLVSGSLSASSAVIINGTATLGGTGTYAGSLTLAADTNLAPGAAANAAPVGNIIAAAAHAQPAAGASIGTMSIGGNLNISAMAAGNGKLQFELGALNASDRIAVGGALSIGSLAFGFNDFTFTRHQGLQNGTYTLVTSNAPISGTLNPNDLTGSIGNGGAGILQISASGTSIELVVTVPPFFLWSDDALFETDNNGDGMSNGLAFLLGAANPEEDSRGLLPAVNAEPGGLVMSFNMRKAEKRGNAAILLQHSGALGLLDTWTEIAVPEANGGATQGVTFTVNQNQSNADLHDVTATISSSEEQDGRLFGRLKATE